jgi:hypothetical protein
LEPGWSGNWRWSRDGAEVARIGFRALEGRVVLDFRVRLYGGDWEPITQTVPPFTFHDTISKLIIQYHAG